MTTDTIDAPEANATEVEDGTKGKDYSVYPRELRVHYKTIDKATFSLDRLRNRLNRAEAALEAAREVYDAKAKPLQESIVRARVMIDTAAATEVKVQEALAALNAPAPELETVDA